TVSRRVSLAVHGFVIRSAMMVVSISPRPLVRPIAAPLVIPSRWGLALPLLPVSGGHMVVADWHHQHGPGDELRRDENPRPVVATAHVPAARRVNPVLPPVEEE